MTLAGEGDRVVLPWEIVIGAYDLTRIRGDEKALAVMEAIVRTSSANEVQYSWGPGFLDFSPVQGFWPVVTTAHPVKGFRAKALAVDDPQGEIKRSLDTYLAGYLFLSFARYAGKSEDQQLFRELSQRVLTKEVVTKWLEGRAP